MIEKRTVVNDTVLDAIRQKLESIEFGHVTVTVQDGKVVQLETSEKTRLKQN
jgi:hypothetical protein